MRLFRKPVPIIVGGFYRSGTSLVRRLLDAHSQIFCGPEVKFWRDIKADYRDDPLAHIRFFSTLASLGVDQAELEQRFGLAYVDQLQACARASSKSRWADKNPENLLYLNEWHRLLAGRFHFLFVVRQPLDALASLQEIGFEKTLAPDFASRVEACRRYLVAGLDYAERYPERTFLLRYEDLVQNPEPTLKSLFSGLGLRFEPSVMTEFASSARKAGIEDPKVGASSVIHADSIGRWRQDLAPAEVELALAGLAPAAKRLGYSLD